MFPLECIEEIDESSMKILQKIKLLGRQNLTKTELTLSPRRMFRRQGEIYILVEI